MEWVANGYLFLFAYDIMGLREINNIIKCDTRFTCTFTCTFCLKCKFKVQNNGIKYTMKKPTKPVFMRVSGTNAIK